MGPAHLLSFSMKEMKVGKGGGSRHRPDDVGPCEPC